MSDLFPDVNVSPSLSIGIIKIQPSSLLAAVPIASPVKCPSTLNIAE